MSKTKEKVQEKKAEVKSSADEGKVINSKRFVIRKKLVGQGKVIQFTTKKGETYRYDHDKVYEANKDRFENMACFQKYSSYTATNTVPTYARDYAEKIEAQQ